MNEVEKEKTVGVCALTGHRVLGKDFNEMVLRDTFARLIQEGVTVFLCGMAVGFDTVCCRLLYELRKEYAITVVACIPFAGQENKFSKKKKKTYEEYTRLSDEKVILYDAYTPGVYFGRNRYMIDRCNVVLAYLHTERGGTHYTVEYAKKKNKQIIYI